ncbi:TPA: TniB family NTP-binding protein [Vibrio parahaemolyticus]|uniref:TniB family NTP-binding protein n=1 Tax=Vibrio parahaemolyticus TaxID=670 RepID=UPI0020C7BE46|nr:TniB family NTP-binding protein [Vibrio parahaemolyticus]
MDDSRDIRVAKAKKAFVITPSVAKVLRYMDRCRDLSDMDSEPTCMMVYGSHGVGKTAIIKKYLKQNEGDSDTEGDTIPVIHIEMPDNAKPVDAARELLLQMEAPLALYDTDLARLTKRIVELIPLLGVKLIIIDEFQHLVDESSNKILTQVGNWLKGILNKSKCPIVLFGMPYSKLVLQANSQLHSRFSIQFNSICAPSIIKKVKEHSRHFYNTLMKHYHLKNKLVWLKRDYRKNYMRFHKAICALLGTLFIKHRLKLSITIMSQ